MRKVFIVTVVSGAIFLFGGIGAEKAFALSPSSKVSDCWKIPENERSERCKEIIKSFEEGSQGWSEENERV